MEKLGFDVVEEILVRLDVKDLIGCKSVCKSWRSFISSPRFVNAHLKRSRNNDLNNHELGHRRIGMGMRTDEDEDDEDAWLHGDCLLVVGSCNGLVCICPPDVAFVVVTNPSTRELRKLPTPPHPPNMDNYSMRSQSCWGFGYDSSTDDYKVIAGFEKSKTKGRMFFYVLTLKSNTWKFIGKVKYEYANGVYGILCGGALHWFFGDENKQVIISLNLSTEEFKEIPPPVEDEEYDCDTFVYQLGIIEECLCVFWESQKWVMKNNKWERYNDHCENKYDIAHVITSRLSRRMFSMFGHYEIYGVSDGERVGSYIRASIFVKSLVSPFTNDDRRNKKVWIAQGKEEKRKRSFKHKKPNIMGTRRLKLI